MTPYYTIINVPQRTPEWFAARCGRLTGSVAGDMLATIGKGEAASRRNLRINLVLERLTGKTTDNGFITPAMQNGIDREAEARARYEAVAGDLVQEIGFVQGALMTGVSPDGAIIKDGRIASLLELKCPERSAHLEVLKTGQLSAKYLAQVTHALWVTGAEWCDWMSYQPDFPDHLQQKLIRIHRDEKAIAEYEAKALAFLVEVDRECEEVRRLTA